MTSSQQLQSRLPRYESKHKNPLSTSQNLTCGEASGEGKGWNTGSRWPERCRELESIGCWGCPHSKCHVFYLSPPPSPCSAATTSSNGATKLWRSWMVEVFQLWGAASSSVLSLHLLSPHLLWGPHADSWPTYSVGPCNPRLAFELFVAGSLSAWHVTNSRLVMRYNCNSVYIYCLFNCSSTAISYKRVFTDGKYVFILSWKNQSKLSEKKKEKYKLSKIPSLEKSK